MDVAIGLRQMQPCLEDRLLGRERLAETTKAPTKSLRVTMCSAEVSVNTIEVIIRVRARLNETVDQRG